MARKKRRLIWCFAGLATVAYLFFFPESPPSAWLRGLLYRVATPLASLWRGSAERAASLYQDYFHLVGVQRENRELQTELQRLATENHRLREWSRIWQAQCEAPKDPMGLGSRLTSARVVAFDPIAARQSITIDAGSDQNIAVDDAVMVGGALLGRVVRVEARFSQVLLLTDPDHAVGVTDQQSRAKGVLVGMKKRLELGRERWLTRAEYLKVSEEIRVGDLLVTSGLDGVFPQGIPVGQISSVTKDAGGLFWRAEVEPILETQKVEWVEVLYHGV